MDEIYIEYAKALADLSSLKSDLSMTERLLNELKGRLTSESNDGSYGIDMSAHASKQILERFEALAAEYNFIYNDVWRPKEPGSSLMSPTNMKSFIIGIIAQAKLNGNCSEEDSKNTNGKEYHYKMEIKKWGNDSKKLVFTGIVENNVIKTGYFNWQS